MAPHSSTPAWKIPWTEEPGGLQSVGSLRVGHDWATSLSLFTLMHWRRKWQPTPVFLPGESQGRGSLLGLPSMGSHRVGHDWSDLAAADHAGDWKMYSSWKVMSLVLDYQARERNCKLMNLQVCKVVLYHSTYRFPLLTLLGLIWASWTVVFFIIAGEFLAILHFM